MTVTGRFDNDHEIHVVYTLTEPKGPAGGVGYFVMTPFETDDGWIVYVNRGFVPARARPIRRRGRRGRSRATTTVVGLLRPPHGRVMVHARRRHAGKNQWFSRDPALYAAAQGLPPGEVAPYIIDARFDPALPGGLPQGGETIVELPQQPPRLRHHLVRAGAALALVYSARSRGDGSRTRARAES